MLLVDLPGWAESDDSMFTDDEGEMTFTDGTDEIQVSQIARNLLA